MAHLRECLSAPTGPKMDSNTKICQLKSNLIHEKVEESGDYLVGQNHLLNDRLYLLQLIEEIWEKIGVLDKFFTK